MEKESVKATSPLRLVKWFLVLCEKYCNWKKRELSLGEGEREGHGFITGQVLSFILRKHGARNKPGNCQNFSKSVVSVIVTGTIIDECGNNAVFCCGQ